MMDLELKQLFESGQITLALKNGGKIVFTHLGRGIAPALLLLDEKAELLRGAEVYDTIIGKAAASIFVLGGAAFVYGQTMSRSAIDLLTAHGISCSWETEAAQIINRSGTGLCPFEQAVLDVERPEDCLPVIRQTLAALRAKQ